MLFAALSIRERGFNVDSDAFPRLPSRIRFLAMLSLKDLLVGLDLIDGVVDDVAAGFLARSLPTSLPDVDVSMLSGCFETPVTGDD